MQLRQVQAHEAPGGGVRKVRRRGHPVQGAPRATGPYQLGHAGGAYLVPEVAALAYRQFARHRAQGPGEGSLLGSVRGGRSQRERTAAGRAPHRGALPETGRGGGGGGVRRGHGRRGGARSAQGHRRAQAVGAAPTGNEGRDFGGQAQEDRQTPQGGGCLPRVGQSPGVDDAGGDPGDPSRPPSVGSARRWPLRHLRSQRPVPPGHQPQQPPQATTRTERARDHHPQREADAAGGGRRPVRQRPSRQDHHRPQQAAAQVALRHAEGQARAFPPEPARQARRLLRSFGHRGRPGIAAAPVRAAEEDGARVVQALHLQQAGRAGSGHHHQERQEVGGAGASRGVGHLGGSHQGASHPAQPRSHVAPLGHSGL